MGWKHYRHLSLFSITERHSIRVPLPKNSICEKLCRVPACPYCRFDCWLHSSQNLIDFVFAFYLIEFPTRLLVAFHQFSKSSSTMFRDGLSLQDRFFGGKKRSRASRRSPGWRTALSLSTRRMPVTSRGSSLWGTFGVTLFGRGSSDPVAIRFRCVESGGPHATEPWFCFCTTE